MVTVRVYFHRMLQDSQELGSDDAHMVSRIEYDIAEPGGPIHRDLCSIIKQPVGGTYFDPIEVGMPDDYDGPMNYGAFRQCVEAYYRRCIHVGPGVTPAMVRFRNNSIVMESDCAFEADG